MKRLLLAAVVSLCAVGLSACSQDQQGTPAQQMSSWVTGTAFAQTLGTLRADMAKSTLEVASSQSSAAVHTVCGVMLVDVESANSTLPTPDTQATNLLSQAYEKIGAAAHECYDSVGDASKKASFARDRSAGLALLSEGQLQVESVLGHAVKPTTNDTGTTGVT